MHVALEETYNAFSQLKQRGIKIRIITEITPENIFYCKKLLEIVQLRHIEGLKSNFGVADKRECLIHTISDESQPLSHAIITNFKGLVEAQQYLFESLWSKSIPAEQRIREIGEGVIPDTIEVIYDQLKVEALYLDLVKNAQSEIMLILPSINALFRQEKINAIQYIYNAARERNVKVRILIPLQFDSDRQNAIRKKFMIVQNKKEEKTDYLNEIISDGNDNNSSISSRKYIDTRYIEPMSETRSTILIVDRKFSLVMELSNDIKETFDEAIGLSIYSNSKPGVFSYVSIFENLWTQTELYQQIKKVNERLEMLNDKLKNHDKILNEFIHIAAHELKNPIQPILGLSQFLKSKIIQKQEEQINTDDVSSILDIIIRNAKKMNSLTDNVLDIAKIEAKTFNLKKEIFNLKELIQVLVDDYIDENNVGVRNDVENYRDIKLSSPSAYKEAMKHKPDLFLIEADKGRIFPGDF